MAVALTTSTDGLNRLAVAGNNAANERKANAAGWLDASATAVRPGILPGPGVAQLTYGSPTADTWYLTAFSAILSDGAGGALEVTTGGMKSEAVTRPGAGTSRYDVIALEPVYTGSPSVSLVRYGGTAAASPVLSTATSQVTANGLIVGYYLVGNTGAPAITMLPKRAAAVGSVVRVYDAADLATLNPANGDLAYQEDTNTPLQRVAGAWVGTAVGGVWQSYTPSWTTAGTTIGNGSLLGRYLQVGKSVDFVIKCIFGTTTNAGSSAPFTVTLPTTPQQDYFSFNARLLYPSAYRAQATNIGNTAYLECDPATAGGSVRPVTNSAPATVAASSAYGFVINGRYETT